MRSFYLTFLFIIFLNHLFAQIGGENTFAVLDLSTSARTVSMGGELIAVFDNDINLVQSNPSLLRAKMDQGISFSYVDYFADINATSVSYAFNNEKIGMIYLGAKSLDYGDFTRIDETGIELGEFTANEQVFTLGIGKSLSSRFNIGMSINYVNSKLDNYYSSALAASIGVSYFNKQDNLCMSILAKDFGRQLEVYVDKRERLPFQLQFGISKGLSHLPFRFSLVAHHLNKFDISNNYLNPTKTDPVTGEEVVNNDSFGKKILRHFIIGGELNPFKKNFYIRGGFNFQRRQDMMITTRPGLVGFSWGIGFRIYKFHLNYSRATYHLSGSTNIFNFSTNISSFLF